MLKRRFELNDGASPKFWQISQKGREYTTNYGRIGAKGRKKTRSFDTPAGAKTAAENAVRQIMEEGYIEVQSSVESNEPHYWGTQLSTLIKRLKSKDSSERVEAARNISHIGSRAAAAVPALTKALSDEDDLMRSWAAGALLSIGPEAKTAAKVLSKSLKDEYPWTRVGAAEALCSIGQRKRGAAALLAFLADEATKGIAGDKMVTLDLDAHEILVPMLRARLESKNKNDAAIAAQILSRISQYNKTRRREERPLIAPADDASMEPPSPAELGEMLQPWFEKHIRPAWNPEVRKGDGKLTDSKFGGNPWLSTDEAWPACKGCDRPLELFLQLNLAELPQPIAKRHGQGLLQLFYCRHNCGDGGFEYFSEWMSHVRIVKPKGAGKRLPKRRGEGSFPAKRIVGWQPLEDLPKGSEQEELGLRRAFDSDTFSVYCDQLGLSIANLPAEDQYEYDKVFDRGTLGDKLSGWPCWIQSPNYPHCPQCDSRMQFVFQVDSEDNLPFMFGDSGCGYLFQCKKHKNVVAFGWDCF